MIRIKQVTTQDRIFLDTIDVFVENHPDGSVFQSSTLFTFFASIANHTPFLFVCLDQDMLVGVMHGLILEQKKKIFIDNGPVLLEGNLEEACKIASLFQEVLDAYKQKGFQIQIR